MTENLTQQQRQQHNNEAEWQRMLRRTSDWILSHNDDGRGPTANENPALALWVREQRRNFADFVTMQNNNHNEFFPTFLHPQHGTFTQRHIDQLNSIGFDWTETEFDIMFRQLENFKLTHGGSCRIPFDYADTELVRWVQGQRDNKSRLDSIGFEWDEENINPNNLCSQCFQKKNNQQPFQQQINQQPTKLPQQQQQQQQQKLPPTEQIHAAARQKRKAEEIQEYGNDNQDESDNDDYCGEDDNAGGNDSGLQTSERGRLKKKYNIDPEQFSHLPNNARKNAIVSAIRAERRRRRERKRKKIVLFGNNSNDQSDIDEFIKEEDGKKNGLQANDEKEDDSSDNSSLSKEEKPPDYNLEELLSDEGEEDPAQFTEEQILAFPVSADKDWDAMFVKLASFRKEHGHANVPNTHPDKTLVQWCDAQRKYIKQDRITKAEMHRLESVGFHKVVDKSNFLWNETFVKLGKLQQKVGIKVTTKLLKTEYHPEADKLRDWMLRQIAFRRKDQLSQRRIEKLDAIGFDWGTLKREDNWEYMFTKLCEYKKENGHCRVPELYYIKEKGKKRRLGVFVRGNRKRREKLSDAKIKRLDDIGFEWTVEKRTAVSGRSV